MRELEITVFIAVWLAVTLALIAASMGQEHTHEGEVGEFYRTWNIPPERVTSCCNNQDCRQAHVRVRNGQWEFLETDGRWYPIPPEKLENNQTDARESPDGFAHVCSEGGYVYCAVLGVQI